MTQPNRPTLDKEFAKLIGGHLRTLRTNLGKTQKEISSQLGLSYQQIWKYEAGVDIPPLRRLIGLCRVLETTIPDLLEAMKQGTPPASRTDRYIVELVAHFRQLPDHRRILLLHLARDMNNGEDRTNQSSGRNNQEGQPYPEDQRGPDGYREKERPLDDRLPPLSTDG